MIWLISLVFFAILRTLYIGTARLKKKPTSSLQRIGSSTANKDFISELPDDILTSIIARLPIKSAIKTSLLSRRWRNLHKLLTSIDLDCGLLVDDYEHNKSHDSELIIDSIDRFLRFWNGSKILTFRLSCCLNKSATRRLKHCIYSLGRFGTEKLILTTCCLTGSYSYSDLSFSCQILSEIPSLRYFHLSFGILQPSLKSQCNSSLKTIYLSYVTLVPGAIECLLSSCLRLETLGINCCKSPSKLSFRGSLKILNIHYCKGVKEIDLYASNLVMFEFMTTEVVNLDVNSLFDHAPHLENVSIDICEYSVPYVCGKLSKGLPNLKSLSLVTGGGDIYQGSSRLTGMNMFSSLRQLNLEVYSTTRVDLLLLTQLLQSCPLLQDFGLHTDVPEYVLPQEEKPVVYHSELKKVEFSGFIGTENDIELALYVLKSATCLEEMLISRYFKMYDGYGSWISRHEDPWSEEMQRMIQEQLQGQAVSMDARVIIQLEPHIEDVEDDCD